MLTSPHFIIVVDKRVVRNEEVDVSEDEYTALDNIFVREAQREKNESERGQRYATAEAERNRLYGEAELAREEAFAEAEAARSKLGLIVKNGKVCQAFME